MLAILRNLSIPCVLVFLCGCSDSAKDVSTNQIFPIAEPIPASMTTIGPLTRIQLKFNKPMDKESFTVLGSMTKSGVDLLWSKHKSKDDLLVILPKIGWEEGDQDLIINGIDAQGQNLQSILNLNYVVDASLPQALPTYEIGATIGGAFTLDFTFSKSMDPESLKLSGSHASAIGEPIWGTQNLLNDQVTISAIDLWGSGSLSFDIEADDTLGNALPVTNINYVVDREPATATEIDIGNSIMENITIVVGFSEPMNPSSLNFVEHNGAQIGTPFWNESANVLRIPPESLWIQGPLGFEIQVEDQYGNLTKKSGSFVIVAAADEVPMANAGADQIVTLGNTVLLDGGGSVDKEDTTLLFEWSVIDQPKGSTIALPSVTAKATFDPLIAGTYEIGLIVVDSSQNRSAEDIAFITVNP